MKEGYRRRGLAVATVGALTLAACSEGGPDQNPLASASPRPAEIPYELQKDPQGRSVDQGIAQKPERGVTSVTIFYDATTEGGSVQAEVCFDAATSFRVIGEEKSPKPGYLVDALFEVPGPGCVVKRPVTQLGLQDHEKFYLGVGQDERSTYNNVLVFDILANNFNPIVRREQNTSLPPNPKLRG